MSPRTDTTLKPWIAAILWLIFAGYVAYVASMHVQGYQAAATGGRPWYTDFTQTYASSLLVREAGANYLFGDEPLFAAMIETAKRAFGANLSIHQLAAVEYAFAPWMYPPTFILVIAPLAFMPYLTAYLAWLVVTAVPYLAAMRAILPDGRAWRNALPIALASPTTYSNLMYGQTGFLSGGLIGLGLHWLVQRPLVAGVLIGLASVKPHLGLLIPVALAAGGHWRTFGSAAATTLGLAILSAIAYGVEPWAATFSSMDYYAEGFSAGGYNLLTMTSVLSTVRVPGGGIGLMWAAQAVGTMAMATLVAWVWRRGRARPDTLGLQSAVLCCATPLALPMVYVYDLAILMPAVAWLWADIRRRQAYPWETAALLFAVAIPMFSYELARVSNVQVGALAALGLLALSLHRLRRANHAAATTGSLTSG
jgi:hypothetical protein